MHAAVYDAFKAKLAVRVAGLTVGHGMRDGVKIGPVISPAALAKAEDFVADAVSKGATVLMGGKRATAANGGRGWFFEPTLLENVTGGMGVMRDEIFGPVVRWGVGWGVWGGGGGVVTCTHAHIDNIHTHTHTPHGADAAGQV